MFCHLTIQIDDVAICQAVIDVTTLFAMLNQTQGSQEAQLMGNGRVTYF